VTVTARAMSGPPPAVTTDGIRLKVYSSGRRPVTIPWADIEALWCDRYGRWEYLYVLPRDLDRYLGRRTGMRGTLISQATARSGTPLQILLPAGRPLAALDSAFT
jgi:hypothetical protein